MRKAIFTLGALLFAIGVAVAGPPAIPPSAPLIVPKNCGDSGHAVGTSSGVPYCQAITGGTSTGGNPTATAGPTAVNGSATTFLRSDGAPAVQKASNAQFGIMEGDGLTIGCVAPAGVCNTLSQVIAGTTQNVTAAQWAPCSEFDVKTSGQTLTLPLSSTLSPTGCIIIKTVGQSVTLAPNGSDAVNGGTTGVSVTIASGLLASVTVDPATANSILVSPTTGGSTSFANPSGTIGTSAVNGSATTAMRSDAAPAIPQASSSTFGAVKVDGTTITASGGVITATAGGSGGGVADVAYVANNYYWGANTGIAAGGAVGSVTTTYWYPIFIAKPITISNLCAQINTVSSGNHFQLGLYANSATTGKPTGSVLASTANILTTTSGLVCGSASYSFASGGTYWVGTQADNTVVKFYTQTISSTFSGYQNGVATLANLLAASASPTFTTTGGTFGTWVSNPTITEGTASTPIAALPAFEVSSVP